MPKSSETRTAFSTYAFALGGSCLACILQQPTEEYWQSHSWTALFLSSGMPLAVGGGILLRHFPAKLEGIFLWTVILLGFLVPIIGVTFHLGSLNLSLGIGFFIGLMFVFQMTQGALETSKDKGKKNR